MKARVWIILALAVAAASGVGAWLWLGSKAVPKPLETGPPLENVVLGSLRDPGLKR